MYKLIEKFKNTRFSMPIMIGLVGAFLLFSILIFSIRYFISYSFIETKFQEITGLKIEFIEPETSLDYKFNLKTKAKEINIFDINKNNKYASFVNSEFNFKPLGLLFNRLYLKKISADDIKIELNRDENGKINLLNDINKNAKLLLNKEIILTRLDFKVQNIDVNFNDEYINKNKIAFNFKDTNIDLSKRKKQFSFKQLATIRTVSEKTTNISEIKTDIQTRYPFYDLKSDKLNTQVDIKNFDLYLLSDFAKIFLSKEIRQTSGFLNLKLSTENKTQKLSGNIKNPSFLLTDGTTISPYKNNLVSFNSSFDVDKNIINLQNTKLTSKDLFISLEGSIFDIFSKIPNLDLNLNIKNTQINNLFYFIPDNAIFYRPKGIPTLKKSNFHGIANGNINIKNAPLNVDGNLKVENVYIPNYPKPFKQNDVLATFMKDKVRIHTRVYTPDNEYVLVDGVSNLDDSLYGEYAVKSTSKIDLSFAQLYLVPIQQIVGFNIGPVPIMDISGYGNIDIDTKGTLSDAQIFGNFEAYNAKAKLDGIDATLNNGKCKLTFEDRNIIFNEISGDLEGAKFSLKGTTNIKGEVKLNALIDNANSDKILKIFKNSIISKPYTNLVQQIASMEGKMKIDASLNGVVADFENKEFLSKLLPSGELELAENEAIFRNNLKINNINGKMKFGNSQDAIFDFKIENSPFNFKFNSKDTLEKIINGEKIKVATEINSSKVSFSDVSRMIAKSDVLVKQFRNAILDTQDIDFYTKISLKSQGEIGLDKINFNTFRHDGYLIGLNDTLNKNVKFNKGIIKIINNRVNFNDIDVDFKQGKIKLNGNLYKISTLKPIGDLSILIKDINFENLDKLFPGVKLSNGLIKTGAINFKNNNIKVNALSIDYANTPLFANATIKDIYNTKTLEADFSTIINEHTADNLINPYLIAPLSVVGEMPIKGSFKGTLNDYLIDFAAILPKDSDISFSGANLGDTNLKREIQAKIGVIGNVAKVHSFKAIKYIANLNNRINPMVELKANGQILQNDNSLKFDNFKISTNTPVNVRVLNMIFKKSLLKRGNFDCDITLNDDVKLPKVSGRVDLYDLDIPLYNSEINSVKMNISDSFIDSVILANNKDSDIKIRMHALNKMTSPYIIKDIIVSSNKLNINNLIADISPVSSKTDIPVKSDIILKPEDFIVEKGSFDFKELNYNDIVAQNLRGNLRYKDGTINIDEILFDIADGSIEALGEYNLNTTKLGLSARMIDCESNTLAKNFFNMSNQVFGKMNGSLVLSVDNLNTPQGIKSLKSSVDFSINEGKMPKLGSLEYLLRAGNLFKNGILGLSLNNIIEVLTPYKTGEFEKITGNLIVNNAEIEKLNIQSKGKNLSMYLEGNYSILDNFADIRIYGKLSQNISNALGALGNASINQFIEAIAAKKNRLDKDIELKEKLEKIPQIEDADRQPRYFKAKVLGDINKENYIKSFDWI